MQTGSLETEIKVIIVGNGGIGKTSLMTRFAEGKFDNQYLKTLGVDFLEKRVFVPSVHENVTFYLYDTAGQEEFHALTRSFYKGAGAAMLAFSTVDRNSFTAIPDWISRVREECGRIPMVLVQTKTDLIEKSALSGKEVEDLVVEQNLRLFQVCAKDNINCNEVFEHICYEYVRRRRLLGNQMVSPVRSAFDYLPESETDPRVAKRDQTLDFRRKKKKSDRTILSNCLIM